MNTDDTPSANLIQDTGEAAEQNNSSMTVSESIAVLLKHFEAKKKEMAYIRPEMLPDIDLYMDQVTTFMDSHLQSTKRYPEDKILTKTMINNYAKNNLLPPPSKKKYSKDHLLLLTFIYYLKNMLSINDIQSLLNPVKDGFFKNRQGGISLEDIYREISSAASGTQDGILADIASKYEKSRDSFTQTSAKEKAASPSGRVQSSLESDTAPSSGSQETALSEKTRSMLQDFTFVCLLCYDIFLKKQLVEQIIDAMGQQDKR